MAVKHTFLQLASALAIAGAAVAAPAAQACDRVETAQSDSQRLRTLMAESPQGDGNYDRLIELFYDPALD